MIEEPAPQTEPFHSKQQIWTNLAESFQLARNHQDIYEMANAAARIRSFTDESEGRKLLMNIGIVSSIVELVDPRYYEYERLIIECSWILCNLAAEDSQDVQYLVDLGVVHKGLDLIRHPNNEAKINAIWLLANIATESLKYRDMLLDHGIVDQIEWLLQSAAPKPSLTSKVAWLIANLTRGSPYPSFEKVCPLVQYLKYFLENTKDSETLSNTVWSLFYLASPIGDQVTKIYELNICSKIVDLAKSEEKKLQIPALKLIAVMLAGADDHVRIFIQHGLLEAYAMLLGHPRKKVRKEVYYGLSNLLGGGQDLVTSVFDFEDSKIIKHVIRALPLEDDELAKECLYCITNACSMCNLEQFDFLINCGVIKLFCDVLKRSEDQLRLISCLRGLANILGAFDAETEDGRYGVIKVKKQLMSHGGFEILEMLQTHKNPQIRKMVARIIEEYDIDL